MKTTIALLTLLLLAATGTARATVPGEINFQGLLLNSVGQPMNGAVDLTFTLYGVETGGSSLWTESHVGVQVVDGVYDVVLGTTSTVAPEILESGSVWLEVGVGTETLAPRQRLLAVPYALRAASAESAEGLVSPAAQVPAVNTAGQLDPSEVDRMAVTLGADGLPVVAYARFVPPSSQSLSVIKCGNPSCDADNFQRDLDAVPVRGVSMVIGTTGNPVILYATSGSGLNLLRCDDPACSGKLSTQQIAPAGTEFPVLTLGLDGFPVLAFQIGADVKLARCSDAACSTIPAFEDVAVGVGDSGISIAMGIDGRAYIAYHRLADGLNLARCDDVDCKTITSVNFGPPPPQAPHPNLGRAPAMTMGLDSLPLIVGFTRQLPSTTDSVVAYHCQDAACTSRTTSTIEAGLELRDLDELHASVSIGADGLPAVAYAVYPSQNPSIASLAVAKCTSASCSSVATTTVLDGPGDTLGFHNDIAVGADGQPTVVYKGAASGNELQVLRCGNPFCVPNWTRR